MGDAIVERLDQVWSIYRTSGIRRGSEKIDTIKSDVEMSSSIVRKHLSSRTTEGQALGVQSCLGEIYICLLSFLPQ